MKQERYLDKEGKRDWIDKCAEELTEEEFDGAMFFTIGKYYQRLGKKDPEPQEREKIADYKHRWIQYKHERLGNVESFGSIVQRIEWQIEQAKELAAE